MKGKKTKVVAETAEQRANREMVEKIAGNIENLADAVASLIDGPLNKKALIVLLASSTKMHMNQVESVLNALQDLKKDWLKK